MQPPAYRIAQYHLEDLQRAAANSARRAEARRGATEGLSPRSANREVVVHSSPFRRLAARFAT